MTNNVEIIEVSYITVMNIKKLLKFVIRISLMCSSLSEPGEYTGMRSI